MSNNSETVTQPIDEVLKYNETDPLDLLNKWWANKIDDDTLFVLLQRHLLNAKEGRTRLADPIQFARIRNANRPQVSPAQQMVNDMHVRLRAIHGRFTIGDAYYAKLVAQVQRMLDDGWKPNQSAAMMLAKGRNTVIMDYVGGKEFADVMQELYNGNFQ